MTGHKNMTWRQMMSEDTVQKFVIKVRIDYTVTSKTEKPL